MNSGSVESFASSKRPGTILSTSRVSAFMIHVLAAIAMIPDRPEPGFPAVGQFASSPDGGGIGNGVAIAPRWVLSCGHGEGAAYWLQSGKHFKIKRRVAGKMAGSPIDLALYELETSVKEFVPPLFLPFEGKSGLRGKEVRLVGFGETGIPFDYGYDGRQRTGGKKRFVTNALDSTMLFTAYAPFRTQVLVYDIDNPNRKDRGSLGGVATPFEGGIGNGDSGSPWLLKVKGKWAVVGISVYTMGDPKGGPHAFAWGAQGAGADLYSYRDWIRKTISTA